MTMTADKISVRASLMEADSSITPPARPMLARDADATYWMARYVERAEHVARMLLVNREALIDVGDLSDGLQQQYWKSVLQIMHCDDIQCDDDDLALRVSEYMTFDMENPNSLIRSLTRARENARGIREVISSEMWEHLNGLYWYIRSDEARAVFQEVPDQLYNQIIQGSVMFQGLTDLTMVHGQRWQFVQLGKYLERVQLVCRIFKSKYDIIRVTDSAVDEPLWNIHWSTVLRSCASLESFRRMYLGEMDLAHVTQFLILEKDFPRSVRYCVTRAHRAIAEIRASIQSLVVDPTERILGRLSAQLEFAEANDLPINLEDYLAKIIDGISQAAMAVQRSYFLH